MEHPESMSEAKPKATQSREVAIADAVSEMLRGMLDGERAVAAMKVPQSPFGHVGYPHVYAVRHMDAELVFTADHAADWRFLWFERRSERPSVQVVVRIGIEPSLDPQGAVRVSRDLRMAVPRFLPSAGAAEGLTLNCASGRRLGVRFIAGGTIELIDQGVAWSVTERSSPQEGATPGEEDETFLKCPARWPMDAIIELLATLAQWRRGAIPSRNMRFKLARGLGGDLDALLAKVLAGSEQVSEVIELERYADGRMAVTALSATVRVHLENDGELAHSDVRPESSQQLDLTILPSASNGGGATLLTLDLPDFLVAGDLHARLLAALRSESAVAAIRVALGHRKASVDLATRPDLAQMSTVLAAMQVPDNVSIIRIDHDDTDLVLLRGEPVHGTIGLLLEVKFRVPRDGGAPAVDEGTDIRLVAHFKGGAWHGALHDDLKAPYYFARILRTLHALQKCVTGEVMHPAGALQ